MSIQEDCGHSVNAIFDDGVSYHMCAVCVIEEYENQKNTSRQRSIEYLRYLGRQLAWIRKNTIEGKQSRPYGEMVRHIRRAVQLLQHVGILKCKYPQSYI